jgi:uncharacterized protein (DUF1778 family)
MINTGKNSTDRSGHNQSPKHRINRRSSGQICPVIRKLILAAAELEGRSLSEFLVVSAKERAEQTLHRLTV